MTRHEGIAISIRGLDALRRRGERNSVFAGDRRRAVLERCDDADSERRLEGQCLGRATPDDDARSNFG